MVSLDGIGVIWDCLEEEPPELDNKLFLVVEPLRKWKEGAANAALWAGFRSHVAKHGGCHLHVSAEPTFVDSGLWTVGTR